MPRAPKAPERPKAAQRHPLPHQRLSRRNFWVLLSGGFQGLHLQISARCSPSIFIQVLTDTHTTGISHQLPSRRGDDEGLLG